MLGQHRKLEAIIKPSEKEIKIGPVMIAEQGKLLILFIMNNLKLEFVF